MSDPIKTLTGLVEKQKQAIEAQRAESERIQKEREQTNQAQTVSPTPTVPPSPNK